MSASDRNDQETRARAKYMRGVTSTPGGEQLRVWSYGYVTPPIYIVYIIDNDTHTMGSVDWSISRHHYMKFHMMRNKSFHGVMNRLLNFKILNRCICFFFTMRILIS